MDADERLDPQKSIDELRSLILSSNNNWWDAEMDSTYIYTKPRVVKKDTNPKFVGKTHEFLKSSNGVIRKSMLPIKIYETKKIKSEEHLQHKFRRDVEILEKEIKTCDSSLLGR